MDYELVVTDLDGTLLTRAGELLPSTLATLRRLADNGCRIATASARTLSNTAAISAELVEICSARACVNGAHIVAGDGRILAHETMDRESVAAVLEHCAGTGASACCAAPDAAAAAIRHPECRTAFGLIHARLQDDLHVDHPPFDVSLVMVYGRSVRPLLEMIGECCPDLEASPVSAIRRHGGEYVFLHKYGVHKGRALLRIAEYCGVDPARTVAFGDSLSNDGPLLDVAGLGVAMRNGSQDLKQRADRITALDHEGDGVGECLRSLFGLGPA